MAKLQKKVKTTNQLDLFSSYQPKTNLENGQIIINENHIKECFDIQLKYGNYELFGSPVFSITLNIYNNRQKPLFPRGE